MKKSFKIISLLLVLMLILSMGAIASSAATSGTIGACRWSLDGTVLTVSGNGPMGYDYIFSNDKMPPWGRSITEVIIEEGVTEIGNNAFANCGSLEKATLPDTLKKIGICAFYTCSALKSIELPDGLEVIGAHAFSGCSELKVVALPKTLSSLGVEAFEDCPALTAINVDGQNKSFCSVDGVLFNKDKTTLLRYPAAKIGASYSVPNTVKEIGYKAFNSAVGLFSVEIPDSVVKIAASAFYNTNMDSAVSSDGGVYVGNAFIRLVNAYYSAYAVGRGTTVIAAYAFTPIVGWELESIIIPEGVKSIDDGAFFSCQSLESVYIPKSIEYIGERIFESCPNIKYVYYGGTAEDRAEITFADNTALTDAKWINNVCHAGVDHTWTEKTVLSLPDCDSSGWEQRKCLTCFAEDNIEIKPLGHEYGAATEIKAPACAEYGLERSVCAVCNHEKEIAISPKGHSFSEWQDELLHTCTEVGIAKRSCSVCDLSETKATPPAGHTYTETETVEPTYEADGYIGRSCLFCDDTVVDEVLARLDPPPEDNTADTPTQSASQISVMAIAIVAASVVAVAVIALVVAVAVRKTRK